MSDIRKIKCKTILVKSKLPGFDYVYNPYSGCMHSCIYCYAKFISKILGNQDVKWGDYVLVKENAIEILRKDIRKVKENETIFLGSVTDVYQPIEKSMNLTGQALDIFKEYSVNVKILTKSDLVLKDIVVLKNMKNVDVGISLGCTKDIFTKITEPQASTVESRLKCLNKLKEAGIKTYVFMSPIIPYVTKLEDNFKAISNDVSYVMGETLNLNRVNIDLFKRCLLKLFDENKVKKIIYTCKDRKYLNDVKLEFDRLCKRYNVENRGFFTH